MPFTAWRQLSREKQRAWGVISGVVMVGTAVKVSYFNFSRGLILSDTERQQKEGYARLEEARRFADWSKKDREARLPSLTPEQEAEMGRYLRLVEAHGWKEMEKGQCDGDGCPVLRKKRARH